MKLLAFALGIVLGWNLRIFYWNLADTPEPT